MSSAYSRMHVCARPHRDRQSLPAPGSPVNLTELDDMAGGRVAFTATRRPNGLPALRMTTTDAGGAATVAIFCRGMVAEIVDAGTRFLATPAGQQCPHEQTAEHLHTLRLLLAETLRLIAVHDTDYTARYPLVWQALAVATKLGYRAGVAVDETEPGWPVVYIDLPGAGQVSWHLPAYPSAWDRHDTLTKYERCAAYRAAVTGGTT